jgi:CHAT domain-containing protein
MRYPCGITRRRETSRVRRVVAAALIAGAIFSARPTAAWRVGAHRQSPAQTPSKVAEVVWTLTPDSPAVRELGRGENHLYEFSLPPGSYVRVTVEQRGIDVTLSIFDRGQNVVAKMDSSNGSRGPETISMISAAGGVFRLRVRGGRISALKPSYQIAMARPRPPVEEDAARIRVEKTTAEAEEFYGKSISARGEEKTRLLTDAIKGYREAREGWRSLGEKYAEAFAAFSLGWCYSDLGSRDMIKFPLPLYRLRWSYRARGDHQTAIAYFKEALAMMKSLGDEHGQAVALAGMAWPNLYLGNETEAAENFSTALSMFESMGNLDGKGRALYGLGWTQAVLNRNEEALENFSKALRLRQAANDRRGEAINLASLARIYSRLGNEQQALAYSERARVLFESKELDDRHGVASTLTTQGWALYGLKRYGEAIDSFQKAFNHRDEHDATGKAVALYGMAKVESERGDLVAALNLMRRGIDLIDPLRTKGTNDELRTYYFANVQEYYSFYTELLMRLHKLHPRAKYAEAALLSNERARARELVAILAEALEDSRTGDGLESAKALTADDIRRLLDEDAILLEYALTESHTYLWTVTASPTREPATQGYELPTGTPEIEQAALRLIEMLKEKGGTIEQFQATANALSKILIPEKVAAQIRSKRKVVIVSEGVLQYVPFASLSVSRRLGVYSPLVVSHVVVTAPSMSTIDLLRRKIEHRPPAPNRIAVIADPVFTSSDIRVVQRAGDPQVVKTQAQIGAGAVGGRSRPSEDELAEMLVSQSRVAAPFLRLTRLVSTRDEAQMISSLEPLAEMYLDFDASMKTVTADSLGSYRIVHFATHGIALDSHPEASGIFLSMVNEQGESEDGYLYFPLVCRLRLPVELVVLSGCETNFGKHVRGEGLIGLTRGFMYAGAPRVIASLWEVRGEATKELMKRFYTLMIRQGMHPSAALSAAQASMWKEQKWTPSDWAAFSYSGEWR